MIFKYCMSKETLSNNLVIIVHGLGEHLARYDNFVKTLLTNNLDVYCYNLFEHEGRKEEKINSYLDYIFDLYKIILEYRSIYKKIFLFGHSMGGEIVSIYASLYDNVEGIITSGASLKMGGSINLLRFVPQKFLSKMYINPKLESKISVSETNKENYKKDEKVLKKIRAKLLYEMFIKGIKYFKKTTSKINVPCLILHGGNDLIINKTSSYYTYYNKVSCIDKIIISYTYLGHEILNEEEKLGLQGLITKQTKNSYVLEDELLSPIDRIVKWLYEHQN